MTGTDDIWLATKAADYLTRLFRAVKLEATQHQTAVSVGGKTISVAVRVNDKLERQGQHFVAAEFHISIDGAVVRELTTGAVGIDPLPAGALATAAGEWSVAHGAPIAFSIATRLGARGAPPSSDTAASVYEQIEIDGATLFHGLPSVRGQVKTPGAPFADDFDRSLAMEVLSSLRRRQHAGEYRSALVQLLVNGTAVTSSECRADGIVAPDLCEAVSKLPWPEGTPSYIFKLFFVLPVPG